MNIQYLEVKHKWQLLFILTTSNVLPYNIQCFAL